MWCCAQKTFKGYSGEEIIAVFETDPTKERSPDRGQGYQKSSFI
jgi:hypothetical protein